MTPPIVLLFGLLCLLSMPKFSNAFEKECKETEGRYTKEQREKLFDAVVAAMEQEPRALYVCSLESLAANIWDDSQAWRDKIIKHNIKEFKYRGKFYAHIQTYIRKCLSVCRETTEDFVTVAANQWKERFQKKKDVKKYYGGCFYGEKNNGKSKAVCLFICVNPLTQYYRPILSMYLNKLLNVFD
ncbi:hypothetical protein Aduo_006061 [Ancylostoma duodenale]